MQIQNGCNFTIYNQKVQQNGINNNCPRNREFKCANITFGHNLTTLGLPANSLVNRANDVVKVNASSSAAIPLMTNYLSTTKDILERYNPILLAMSLSKVKECAIFFKEYPFSEQLQFGPTDSDYVFNGDLEINDVNKLILASMFRLAPQDMDLELFSDASTIVHANELSLIPVDDELKYTPDGVEYKKTLDKYNRAKDGFVMKNIEDAVGDSWSHIFKTIEQIKKFQTWNPILLNRANHEAMLRYSQIKDLYGRTDELRESVVTLYKGLFAVNEKLDKEIEHNRIIHQKLNSCIMKYMEYQKLKSLPYAEVVAQSEATEKNKTTTKKCSCCSC